MLIKRFILAPCLSLAMLFTLFGIVMAQAPEVNLTADKEIATLGEVVELTLVITHPTSIQITIPSLTRTWGDVEVRNQSLVETRTAQDGLMVTRQTIDISRFSVGAFQTPPLTIIVGDAVKEIPRLSLMITSVLTAESSEIQPIRPQAELPLPPIDLSNPTWWALAALIVVTALVYWWVFRNKLKPQVIPVYVDPRQPHEIAFDELDRIAHLNLPAQKEFKQYYILLADCLRTYLQGRYQFPAMDFTTSEIKSALRRVTISPEQTQALMNLLNECDLGKFAEFTPTVTEAEGLLEQARHYINEELKMSNEKYPESAKIREDN